MAWPIRIASPSSGPHSEVWPILPAPQTWPKSGATVAAALLKYLPKGSYMLHVTFRDSLMVGSPLGCICLCSCVAMRGWPVLAMAALYLGTASAATVILSTVELVSCERFHGKYWHREHPQCASCHRTMKHRTMNLGARSHRGRYRELGRCSCS